MRKGFKIVLLSPQEKEGGGNSDSAEIGPKALRGAGELNTPSHIKAPSIMNKPHARLSTKELY
jgi:hypothetical protein